MDEFIKKFLGVIEKRLRWLLESIDNKIMLREAYVDTF